MEKLQDQRLLYDIECKDCNSKALCEWADTDQCCRKITDKLRLELRNNKKRKEIIAKITITTTTEYVFSNYNTSKDVSSVGTFKLKEPYRFGYPFLRAEIQGKSDGGEFSTRYYKWNKT